MIKITGQEKLHPNRRKASPRRGQWFLSTDPQRGNVNAGHRRMRQLIGHRLSAISLDLLDVAAYLYTADKLVRRDRRTWVRDLTFELPVRELERWDRCKELIEQTIGRLSGDNVTFEFTQRTEEGTPPLPGLPEEKIEQDCVVLFSGGLDSCAGVAQLLCEGQRPLLVSHSPGVIGGVQARLAQTLFIEEELKKRIELKELVKQIREQREKLKDLKEWDEQEKDQEEGLKKLEERKEEVTKELGVRLDMKRRHFQIRLGPFHRKDTQAPVKSKENSQRVRAFLYLALGTVVAQELGIPKLYIVDNGILSINLPLVPCRAGSRSTRSTDPLFLGLYQELVSVLYAPRQLTVVNPFIFKTKKEVVGILRDLGLQEVIQDTVTCYVYPRGLWSLRRSADRRQGSMLNHCGYCISCLVRRIAILACGLEKCDAGYFKDVIGDFGCHKDDYSKTNHLLDLIYFCSKVKSLERKDEKLQRAGFLAEYPELALVGRGPLPKDTEGEPVQLAIDMYKRFATEVLQVVGEYGDKALKDWMS